MHSVPEVHNIPLVRNILLVHNIPSERSTHLVRSMLQEVYTLPVVVKQHNHIPLAQELYC